MMPFDLEETRARNLKRTWMINVDNPVQIDSQLKRCDEG